jgi:hypothetical protein
VCFVLGCFFGSQLKGVIFLLNVSIDLSSFYLVGGALLGVYPVVWVFKKIQELLVTGGMGYEAHEKYYE